METSSKKMELLAKRDRKLTKSRSAIDLRTLRHQLHPFDYSRQEKEIAHKCALCRDLWSSGYLGAEIASLFGLFAITPAFLYHCHNLEHESGHEAQFLCNLSTV